MAWCHDVMCMYAQASECIYGQTYSHKAHKAFGLGLYEVQVLPSFSLLVKTCPTRSNRVLRVPISLDCFHCSSFRFSHWTGDQNIPGKQPSIECSIEYQPTSDCTKVSYLTTLKKAKMIQLRFLRSVDASRHHAAAPYSPWLNSRVTGTHQSATST